MSYAEKIARKNEIPYMKVKRIYLGDSNTYLESTGQDTWQIISPKGILRVGNDGIYMSGNTTIDSKVTVNKEIECKGKITTESLDDKSKKEVE